ncbi:hypothetical protein [Anaeromicropila herbilytica]|uniref:Uncharacterized protein n=1 Tax=Anaeromicropila herbilytica TaxID=2785025 RepID=A0A7R7EK12_9FIRM|nr:hypothetical protein [Anaeromicropila herbilytica]BCN30225.1 hypothetical protein bsdtb5_15200 [Anaeromicropila herbilytica]
MKLNQVQSLNINQKSAVDIINNVFAKNEEEKVAMEQKKQAYAQKICQKVQAGKKLTAAELNFLRETDPVTYMKAIKLQYKRQAVENHLKNCSSKEEVEDVISMELGSISKEDPDKEAMINAVQEAVKEYKKTDKYQGLPEKSKEEKRVHKSTKNQDSGIENSQKENTRNSIEYNTQLGTYQEVYLSDSVEDMPFDLKS